MIIYVRPRNSFEMDGFVEWSNYKRQTWYPISHIYVGQWDELPEPGNPFKTKVDSLLKERLNELWNVGRTAKVRGEYNQRTRQIKVVEILE